jgi:hypothetical protein
LEKLVLAENEITRFAARRNDLDVVTRGARRAQRVPKVFFDVAARHAELARKHDADRNSRESRSISCRRNATSKPWPVRASDALQFSADVCRAPFGCNHPRSQLPRRIVPHVLTVPALQIATQCPSASWWKAMMRRGTPRVSVIMTRLGTAL